MRSYLSEHTQQLHAACEQHPVGEAMAAGNPPDHWYAGWLRALHTIHTVIDTHAPECAHRTHQLEQDLSKYPATPQVEQAARFAKNLADPDHIEGAVYVLLGAHLMGGEILKRRLADYPTAHLEWQDRSECLQYLGTLRNREDLLPGATACFQGILDCMQEIHQLPEFQLASHSD